MFLVRSSAKVKVNSNLNPAAGSPVRVSNFGGLLQF
jgi:hypothetical protein